jgi:hypothetical protein
MAQFREIPEETFREASEIMRAVSGRGPRPDLEVMPGFEGMVAGAAVALEKGAPNLVADNVPLSTTRMFDEATPEYRMLHRSVARAIDVHRQEPWHFEEPNDVMNHIASDMWTQGRASRMDLAVSNSHASFQEGLTASERGVVRYARESEHVARDVSAQVTGSYELMDDYSQKEIRRDLSSGDVLPKEVKASISESYDVVSLNVEHVSRNADLMNRLGDLQDYGMPVFKTPLPEHFERAQALADGRTQPVGEVDRAIVAHAALSSGQSPLDLGTGFATSPHAKGDIDRIDAYSRALSDFSERGAPASQVANRIEGDLAAVVEARRVMANDLGRDEMPEGTANIAHRQRYAELDVSTQASLYARLESGEHVPALASIRLGHAVASVERGDIAIGRDAGERDARVNPGMAAAMATRTSGMGA